MNKKQNEALQALCREYLGKLRHVAKKHGLGDFVDETIKLNKAKKCQSTERECMMLSRMVDEERLHRTDVPKLLGKSYTQCFEDDDFSKIKKLRRVGIYSKVSAILFKAKTKKNVK